MTVTEFNNALANLINQTELPFDAKVFVVRSIHTEMEQKYAELIKQMQAQMNQTESIEPETEQGGN